MTGSGPVALPLGYTPIGVVGFVSAPTMPIVTAVAQLPQPLENCLSLPRFSSTSARLPYPTHPRKCPGSRNCLRLDVNSLGVPPHLGHQLLSSLRTGRITTRQKLATKMVKSNVVRKVRIGTTQTTLPLIYIWSSHLGLNEEPFDYKSNALTS